MKKVMRMSKVALVLRFVLVGLCVFAATGFSCALEPAPSSAPAAFRIAELSVNPIVVEPGEEVTIKAKVTNIGGSIGSYTAELKLNDVIEVAREVDLAPGTNQPLRFSVNKDTPGTYIVTLGELTGNFVVIDPSQPPPAPTKPALPALTSAACQVTDLSVNPSAVDPGEEVTIEVKVANISGAIGSYTAELKINDVIEVAREVDLAPGTSRQLRFSVNKDIPDSYTVTLGELTGNFVVLDTAPPAPALPTRIWVLTDAEATDLLRRSMDIDSITRTSVHFVPDNKVVFRKDSDKITTTANIYEGKLYLYGVRPEEWFWLKWHIGSYTSYSKPKTKVYLTGLPPWFDPTKEIASDVTELPTFVSITMEEGRAIITYLRP